MIGPRLCAVMAAGVLLAACGRGQLPGGAGESGTVRFSILQAEPASAASQRWTPVINDM
jgi:hypothetical protein